MDVEDSKIRNILNYEWEYKIDNTMMGLPTDKNLNLLLEILIDENFDSMSFIRYLRNIIFYGDYNIGLDLIVALCYIKSPILNQDLIITYVCLKTKYSFMNDKTIHNILVKKFGTYPTQIIKYYFCKNIIKEVSKIKNFYPKHSCVHSYLINLSQLRLSYLFVEIWLFIILKLKINYFTVTFICPRCNLRDFIADNELSQDKLKPLINEYIIPESNNKYKLKEIYKKENAFSIQLGQNEYHRYCNNCYKKDKDTEEKKIEITDMLNRLDLRNYILNKNNLK